MRNLFTSIIILLIMAIALVPTVYAEETTSNNVLSYTSSISGEGRTVSVTISLGEIENIDGAETVAYQATLDYDGDILTYDKIETSSGWSAKDAENTENNGNTRKTVKFLIEHIEGTKVETNEQMAEIKFKIKDGIETLDSNIELKNIELSYSVDKENEETINPENKSLNVKLIKEEQKEEEKELDNKKEYENTREETPVDIKGGVTQENNESDKIKTVYANENKDDKDKTTTTNVLPKTGAIRIISIALVILLFTVVFFVRYKSIEIK